MQCACAILPSVAFPNVQYFSTLSHKRHESRKCVFWFSLQISSGTFVILKNNWGRYDHKCTGLFISPCGNSDLYSTVAGMDKQKGRMSTEGEALQVSVLPYRFFKIKPCINMTSLNNNQLMHSQFNIYLKHIKSSCKIYSDMFRIRNGTILRGSANDPS